MNDELRYRQFAARDRGCDGKFVAAVLTTGIYCLPSCPARRPKRENVRFYKTIEEAQAGGMRPCLRCRPDWFYRGAEWHESLYEQTVARVRDAPGAFRDVGDIAAAAGVGRTALNGLFREHGHESPGAFLKRMRVAHACGLLERGVKPAEAGQSTGFAASSAFHQQFLARTGLTPGAYAALADARAQSFSLRLPHGYRTHEVLDFHGRDPESESVYEDGFDKAAVIGGKAALIAVRFGGGLAMVNVDGCDALAAHRMIVRMLGLDSDAAAFERQFGDDPLLGALAGKQRGLRIPLTPEPWEALAWAIIGQQISVKAAVSLRRELIRGYGLKHAGGLRGHPSADVVAALDPEALRALKFPRSKAEYLVAAAKAVVSGEVPMTGFREVSLRCVSVRRTARLLGQVRGIGPWTVQYVLMRGFGFADCLPSGDAGLAQGLARFRAKRPEEAEIREIMARFSPYRSLATCHVWASLKREKNINAA